MDVGTLLQSVGVSAIDLLVVAAILLLTQIVKRLAGKRPWIVAIPMVFGVGFGVALHASEGIVLAIAWGFVLGTVSAYVYMFGTRFLGIRLPGEPER